MIISIFLAKAFGLYLLAVSLAILRDPVRFQRLSHQLLENELTQFLSAILALILGILLVISHNIWVLDWRIIVTILSWMAFMKGCLLLFFPSSLISIRKKLRKIHLQVFGVAYVLLALFLCWKGFIE